MNLSRTSSHAASVAPLSPRPQGAAQADFLTAAARISSTGTGRHSAAPLVLTARNLEAHALPGRVFGPLDLDLHAGELCVVDGPHGAGKSSLLLALSGRFRRTKGSLEIAGIDALAHPYQAKKHAAVARLGDYVGLEDRLTVSESIVERAYLDGIASKAAEARFREIEEHFGFEITRKAQVYKLPTYIRLAFSVALVALAPAKVIVVDDVEAGIPAEYMTSMYAGLEEFARFTETGIVATCSNGAAAPESALRLHLQGGPSMAEADLVTPIAEGAFA